MICFMRQLSKRQIELIKILGRKDVYTAERIGELLRVSSKTIRNEIRLINHLYPGSIQVLKARGYRLNNKHIFETALALEENEDHLDRSFHLLKMLLSGHSVDYYEICEKLYISETTLNNSISQLNDIFFQRKADITIQRKNNQVFLIGDEKERRQISSYLFMNEIDQYGFDVRSYQGFFESVDLSLLRRYTLSFIQKNQLEMKDIEIISFMIHVAIMLERVGNGYHIDTGLQAKDERSKKYAKEFCDGLKILTDVTLDETEVDYLSSLFSGKLREFDLDELEKIRQFIIRSLKETENNYSFSFSDDQKLIDNLVIHVVGLQNRIKNDSFLKNPLKNDIKNQFPLFYDASVYLASKIQEEYGTKLYEDEIAFITLHLMGSAERLHSSSKRKVVVISPIGGSPSQYIKNRLTHIHEFSIEICAYLSLFNLNEIEKYDPDLLISFGEINSSSTYPLFVSHELLSDQEIEEIYRILKLNPGNDSYEDFFDKDLYYDHIDFSTKNEIIHFLVEEAIKTGLVDDDFENLVLQREKIAPTSYGSMFAIPHPIKKKAYKNKILIGKLNKPVSWNRQKVRIVFLICVSENNNEGFEELFERLVNLLDYPEKVKRMIRCDSYEEFMKIFKE